MSGLYLNPYRGYEGNPGNNGGLSIPHRSKYNCSSNLRIENEKGYRTQHVPTFTLSLSFSHSPTHAHTSLSLCWVKRSLVRRYGRVDTLPISVLKVWRWVETVMIRIVGRRIQGKSRWSVGRMVFRPVRLKTGTGQQFGSSGSYAVLAGIRGSRSRVQRRNLLCLLSCVDRS